MTLRGRSARFVGRADELARLEQALGRAGQGVPTVVLLGGDAGVGKTRLLEEFTEGARGQGARVLTGGCLELWDGGLPYGAVTEVLRELAAEVGLPELRRLAGRDARELQRLAPGVRPADQAEGEGRAIELDGSSQLRLFEALLGLVRRLAAEGPLVVVLEDVHWADTSTRDLLVFLAHNLQRVGVVMVATYRTDGLHRQHPLRPVLAQMLRGGGVDHVDVAPFDRGEVALLLEGILNDRPDPELLERVLERSQGNAFFAEELLAAGGVQDAELPEALRDILLVRIDSLPPGVVGVLRVVAAAGGIARHGLVAHVGTSASGADGADLDGVLRVAIEQGVLVADGAAGTYAFRHALLSEAVYSTLLPGEVGRLHGALATAIEADPSLASRSAAAELAVHWDAAEDQPRALSAAVQAAREAEAAAGIAEARRHVERVLQLWPQVDDAAERSGLEHTTVTQWAAELSYLFGDPGRAVALQEQALAEEADSDPAERAVLFARLGRFRWESGDSPGAEAAYVEALRLMPEEPPSTDRARVLSGYSGLLMVSWRSDESDHYGQQALTMSREVGALAVEGHALNTLGRTLTHSGDEGGLELLREARAIAEDLAASDDIMRAYNNEAAALLDLGRFDEAIEAALEGLERARKLGFERQFAPSLSNLVGTGAFYAGRWQLADEILRTTPRDAGGVGAGWAHLARAYLSTFRGEAGLARDELAAAERFHAHVNVQSRDCFVATQLLLALHDGDAEQAHELIEARPATHETCPTPDGLQIRAHILHALADLDISDPHDPPLPDRVLAECHALASKLGAGNTLRAVWTVLAEAEHARAVHALDSLERWTTVIARCDEVGMVYFAAYARYRLAQTLLDDGTRDDVADLLRAAHDVAHDLAAQPLVDDLIALARRARIDLGTKTATSPADGLGLTPREIEVLMLVADGRTNREIAQQLYISTKTASVHVSNILRKLEVSNRGEAAALAHRHGLTTT
jgi:DNA-binding CsgD family transcriptional regulator/tetratricopeptide (TPR) repeat protein